MMGSCRSTTARRAFTLVELLTVLAIMSILLSIALPSIARVRQQVWGLSCQRNLADVARGLSLYALEHDGWLPSGPIELGGARWRDDPDCGSPIELYNAGRIAAGLTNTAGWYGQGMAWKGGYLDSGRCYYCPQREAKGRRGYEQSWPANMDGDRNPAVGDKRVIYGSYAYRGGLWSQRDTRDGPLNLTRPATLGVLADYAGFSAMWHEGGYNAAFLGGHVSFIPAEDALLLDGRLYVFWEAIGAYSR